MPAKLSLEIAKHIAKEQEGNCLFKKYVNCMILMDWICKKEHIWTTSLNSIKNNKTWCPVCKDTRLNISVAKELALSRGGKCLSENYINNRTPLLWTCKNHHQWHSPLSQVKDSGHWCRRCNYNNIEVAKTLAHTRNGECLSSEYLDNKSPLQWKCVKGHLWTANLNKVKDCNQWCPTCSGRNQTIFDIKILAQKNNGECLSDQYYDAHTKLLWRCENFHIWEAPPLTILRGSWCRYCAGTAKLNIEIANQIALSRQGQCLSVEYKNISAPLLWACQYNHQWWSSLSSIKHSDTWCPYCAGMAKHTLDDAKQIALTRGGKCLSTEYKNNKSPLLWICKNQHKWYAKFDNIVNKCSWCPYCSKYKRENLCRQILTKYLGLPSENRKPDFLKTPEHSMGLQLDIPYYHYRFAIKVQGEQHDKYIEFFHRGDLNNFIKQQERDQLKKELCKENCVDLKYVWYYKDLHIVISEYLQELDLI